MTKPDPHCGDVLDGRRGYRLEADWGRVSMLAAGGHICEFATYEHGGVNPLWNPPWKTIDPRYYRAGKHDAQYGPPPDGRLLCGLAGHSLASDHFGPPSPEETRAGLSTHGEAPVAQWSLRKFDRYSIECHAALPEARIRVRRQLLIDSRKPVLYCEEQVENQTPFDRPISWNQHVTLGPPFLETGVTRFDMPATHCRTCPAAFSPNMPIRPDSDFQWPMAPAKQGEAIDLTATPSGSYGQYTAQLLDPNVEHGWVAASNARLGMLIVYVFERASFPWVGNWQERFSRPMAPWGGQTFCRALEFGTTPWPIPRRQMVDHPRLFDTPTYVWLAARRRRTVRYFATIFNIEPDFGGVEQVALEGRTLQVISGARSVLSRKMRKWL